MAPSRRKLLATTPAASPTVRLAIARDVARAFLGNRDPAALARLGLDQLRSLVRADCAAVWFADGDGALGPLAGERLDLPPGLSVDEVFGEATSGAVLWLDAADAAEGGTPLVRALAAAGALHALVTPLVVRDSVQGLVAIWRREAWPFEETELAALDDIATPLALALDNARLLRDLTASLDALRRTQKALVRRERLAAVGTMAAVLAHEVRSPLAVIVNAVAALRRTDPGAAECETLLGIIDEESGRLERLVDDLLDLGRPEAPPGRPVDPVSLVEDAVHAIRQDPRIPPAVRVAFRSDVGEGLVRWDPRGVRQAVVNLVLNGAQAIAAGPGAGEVAVTLEASDDGDALWLSVRDEGPGIDPAIRDRMFEPFVTSRATGSGLGLAVVRRVADDHGGDVAVEDLEGGGARVALRLPIAPFVG